MLNVKRLDLDASRSKAKKAQQAGGEKLQIVSGGLGQYATHELTESTRCTHSGICNRNFYSDGSNFSGVDPKRIFYTHLVINY